jgi:acyl carrier protein
MDLKENIRQYIAKNMLFSDEGFPHGDDASFLEEGIIDSVGFMELVAYVQQTFGIEVGPEDLVPDNFDSVNKLARYVASKKS